MCSYGIVGKMSVVVGSRLMGASGYDRDLLRFRGGCRYDFSPRRKA